LLIAYVAIPNVIMFALDQRVPGTSSLTTNGMILWRLLTLFAIGDKIDRGLTNRLETGK